MEPIAWMRGSKALELDEDQSVRRRAIAPHPHPGNAAVTLPLSRSMRGTHGLFAGLAAPSLESASRIRGVQTDLADY